MTASTVQSLVLPNLITLATGNKEISRPLGCCDIVVIRHNFGAQLIVLCNTIILPDPCDIREQASESRTNNLFLSCCAFHYRSNFFGPNEGFASRTRKCCRRPDDSDHPVLP